MRRILVLLAAVLLLPAISSAETIVIRQLAFYFSPKEVVIAPGDTVRWEWTGGSHTVTEGTDGVINGNELWTSSLNSSTQVFSFTFTPAFLAAHPHAGGRYDFFCQPHFSMGMRGGVTVVDPAIGSVFCAGDGSGHACPCGNNASQPVGCLNSDGLGGRLRALGTPSVSADTLVLDTSGAPESGFVLFFQGSAPVAGGAGAVFGDGLRCAGGASVRLGTKTISFGSARYPEAGDVGIAAKGLIPAGAVRHYQVFYRDPPSTCTGARFNTTNGFSVTWQA